MTAAQAKPQAYSYIRMSTDIQLKGDSLRRQSEASRRYAAENDLELIDDFISQDIGVSAFTGANIQSGALGQFLQAVKDGVIQPGSFLIVESLDRISRQHVMDSVSVFFDIVKNGVNVVTLADNHVYRAGQTELTDLVYAVVVLSRAYEESKTKSIRVGAAWANKRKNASEKVLTRTAPSWLKLTDDRSAFELLEDRAATIRKIFAMAEGGFGSFAITRRLNEEGVPTFQKSKGWHEAYITRIINNRSVLGEFQPHRYEGGMRWSRLVRQFGGLAKVDRVGFYATNCSVISAVA